MGAIAHNNGGSMKAKQVATPAPAFAALLNATPPSVTATKYAQPLRVVTLQQLVAHFKGQPK
jgi:hypothetical protein